MNKVTIYADGSISVNDRRIKGGIDKARGGTRFFRTSDKRFRHLSGARIWGHYTDSDLKQDMRLALPATKKRNPIRKITRRKKRRTPAQKRATAKLIALNRRRGKTQRKPAPKKRPLTPAQKRAVKRGKTARRKSHVYGIKVAINLPRMGPRWYTGKGFVARSQFVDYPPKRFATEKAALEECRKIAPRLPGVITSVKVVKL